MMTAERPTRRLSSAEVADMLRKVVPETGLYRIPRNPEHQAVVLAVLCLGLRRRYAHSEQEINDYLKSRLSELSERVDHVTCRRYLVDLGFLKRNRAGTRYILNYRKVKSVLSDEAIEVGESLLLDVRD